ncbi:acyl-CoA dehydrogenase family protein [Streptomyces avidinii]|uniref:Alkylation response protein AidB-like acyl-CoA dehydrogenase n=1 Tax=Streptomyces avidinii TaxID=1895 RepID=A0ABS4L935_STRAV|nr:acyl-CoA dehydrogenase family protein [Streptomyces avidinii]MBP2038604.1 alkylation response protein AidB-like acyl-CoA dehydrogenase [Streptomyces avidinii]GGZ23545.1 acyl-CoA dehydrogenase [Streptomyces avidinii]
MSADVPEWPTGLAAALADAMAAGAAAGGAFSTARSAALDAAEAFPGEECDLLDASGLARAYVPERLGGVAGGLPELLSALREVARRDVTVAVAHGKTFLGSVSTWVAGTEDQQRALARLVTDENAVVAWGLTERGMGSDLLAGNLTATPEPDGTWRITGEKWPINNATRGRLICVLARTDPAGGPRGFSLFLIDKSALPEGAWEPLPKEPTHGIRGADISGLRLRDAPVPADALVGGVGDGLGIVLRALQLTRTLCAALSLGAGEHALRLVADFAVERALHGTRLALLPLARRVLGRAAASLALADAAALLGGRSAHGLPGEMSAVSATVKAGVPWIVQQAIDDLAELLGARGFLTEQHADGMFQKLERDHRIVAVFDGSTAVNRSLLISQFPLLARLIRKGSYDATGLAAVTGGAPLPELDPAALRLVSRTGCSIVQAVPDTAERITALAAAGELPPRAAELAALLAERTGALADAMAELPPTGRNAPAAAFAVARQFEACFAGAAALHLLAVPCAADRAVVLTAALERCLELLVPGHQAPSDAFEPLVTPLVQPVEEPVR